ncbi:MAG: hypothetical protein R3257_06185 [bacterium]|nr:hypothetical protein [bacterium]
MLKFSVLRPTMFLLGTFLLGFSPAQAWNPDYGYGLPKQRRMCVKSMGDGRVQFRAILSHEDCPQESRRYIVIFGKEPRGAIGLLKSSTSQKFYPPLTLKWPTEKNPSRTELWHFTCVTMGEREILGSKVSLYKYLGEITAQADKDCLEVEARALQFCQKELKGESLLESCLISWGS